MLSGGVSFLQPDRPLREQARSHIRPRFFLKSLGQVWERACSRIRSIKRCETP